jgi:hypothetical protein
MEAFPPALQFEINQGAEALDRYFDGDTRKWLSRIVKEELKLSNPCQCVLGQVFEPELDEVRRYYNDESGYDLGLELLNIRSHEAVKYGFDAKYNADLSSDQEYAQLTAAWLAKIAELEAALAPEEEES